MSKRKSEDPEEDTDDSDNDEGDLGNDQDRDRLYKFASSIQGLDCGCAAEVGDPGRSRTNIAAGKHFPHFHTARQTS